MDSLPQCTALNVSDEKRCEETATSMNGLFCSFHSHQCQGLYRGYKRRNARLDKISASPPQYLADSKIPLSNQTFVDVDTEELCQEIHDHLFLKYQLLERVIRARKLHHSRFFAMNYDYGHAKFLDALQGQKAAVTRALERIERRTAEVLYKNQKWFKWVRECQDEEEAHREKEQRKVKQEAAMFRRHWKATQERLTQLRTKEDRKKQDAFLEKVYKERLAQQEEEDEDEGEDWDPIEDVLEDSRGSFIDLIQRFLWIAVEDELEDTKLKELEPARDETDHDAENSTPSKDNAMVVDLPSGSEVKETSQEEQVNPSGDPTDMNEAEMHQAEIKPSHSKKTKTKGKKKGGKKKSKQKTNVPEASKSDAPLKNIEADTTGTQDREPDVTAIETREEMYERLKNGIEYSDNNVVGRLVGTVENPVLLNKTVTFDDDEIEKLQGEVTEIKHLLFCRLILGQAALLPAALRANNVEEFLADYEVTAADLRDLCLKMEHPGLQDIRDACADFFRSEDEEDDPEESQIVISNNKDDNNQRFKRRPRRGELPEKWISKREEALKMMGSDQSMDGLLGQGNAGTAVDFGEMNDNKSLSRRKIRVKICGRSIWNYPSDKAMNRGGWLHFCIIAKDSSLNEAVGLCRHWDEFFELNILAVWQYFPGAGWTDWVGNRYRSQMLQLGFIMYMESVAPDAMEMMERFPSSQSSGRSGARRSHQSFEARNFICAHVKRDDQISRRLIQYLSMQSHQLVMLVRDAESGRLLIKPEEDETWLYRQKAGLGRASKNPWKIIKKVGPQFFEEMDHYRSWNFSFKEYYDIYVWDLEPGLPFAALYNVVQEMLFKAHRFYKGLDMYNPAASILKTLSRDHDDRRVRDIKEGDHTESIYDKLHGGETAFKFGRMDDVLRDAKYVDGKWVATELKETEPPRSLFYNEADALEDQILFPEERSAESINPLEIGKIEPIGTWMNEGFPFQKFIEGHEFEPDSDFDTASGHCRDSDCDTMSHPSMIESGVSDESGGIESDCGSQEGFDKVSRGRTGGSTELVAPNNNASDASTAENPDELKELMARVLRRRARMAEKDHGDPRVIEAEFFEFLDKEKSQVFKKAWHNADLEPHAQLHYLEMKQMVKYSRRFSAQNLSTSATSLIFQIFDWLDVLDDKDSRDVHKAVAKISPFFDPEFLDSEHGKQFKDSFMLNQDERAKHPPNIRSHNSNKTRPEQFWQEFDEATQKMKHNDDLDALPFEMDIAIRPIIAHLYKSGVIRSRAVEWCQGQAMAGKDPGSDRYDLFIDHRQQIQTIRMAPIMEDPATVPAFKPTARAFSLKYPKARFAILKIWSAPHFYPLMIGADNHDPTSFRDLVGRHFEWMFVPKDMPCSEYSIHFAVKNRISPYNHQFKDRVVVKRDAYLVMGEDEKDLFKLASATTYAVQRNPWRLEVDLWKSWVNVDMEFLEKLDDRWLL